MRITLSGNLGSGKSTIGVRLSERLNIPYISTGRIFREIGHISNLTALQTNLAAEDNAEIDFAVDNKIKELDQTTSDFILDSRMAWHFVHGAINVFLSVEPETAAARIMGDPTRSGEAYADAHTALESLRRRRESENKRYRILYGVDSDDINNYQLVIITDDADPDDIVTLIADFAKKKYKHKLWIPKTRVVPMISIRDASGLSFAARLTPADPFFLRLCVKRNFGFFFGNANDLVNALHFALKLIPYACEVPPFLSKPGYDIFKLARETLRPSDLYDWEEISGDVEFAFSRQLMKTNARAN